MQRLLLTGCVLIVLAAIPAQGANDPVVARAGTQTYTLGDFNRWIGYHGDEAQATLAKDLKQRHALLKRVVVNRIIADYARAQGFDQRPAVREKQALVVENFLATEYLEEVVAGAVKATDEEVQQYYEQHPDEFTTPEAVRASHILVQVARTAPEPERAAARAKLEGIQRRLQAGEDFATLARELSEDPGAKQNGGDLGFSPRGRMVPEFETVAFALKPGETSGVVETQFGFHLIRVEERRAAECQPLAAVQQRIAAKIARERQGEAVSAFVEKVSKEAGMELIIEPLIPAAGTPDRGN